MDFDNNRNPNFFKKLIAAVVTLAVLIIATIIILPKVLNKQSQDGLNQEPTGSEIISTETVTPTTSPDIQPTPVQGGVKDPYVDSDVTTDTIDDFIARTISGRDLTYLLSTMDREKAYLVTWQDYIPAPGDRIFMVEQDIEGKSFAKEYRRTNGNYDVETFVNTGHQIEGGLLLTWDEHTHQFYVPGQRRQHEVGKIVYEEDGTWHKDVSLYTFLRWDDRPSWEADDTFYIWELYSTEEELVIGYVFEPTDLEFRER